MRRTVPRLTRFALATLRVQSRSLSNEVKKPNVTIFGGNGTLGRQLVQLLAPISNEITIGCRSFEKYNENRPFENVRAEYGDIRDESAVERLVQGRDHVINLVGPLYESDNTYVEVYVDGTKNVAHAAYKSGVPRLVHVSAVGAQVDHPSELLDFKFRSEDMAYACYPDVTIVRPSIMFDDDRNSTALVNRLAQALRFAPVVPSPSAQSSLAVCILSNFNTT
jgi:NADH dehydrogenase